MRKNLIIFQSFLFLSIHCPANAEDFYSIKKDTGTFLQTIPVGEVYRGNINLTPFKPGEHICGLSVDGVFHHKSEPYLLRIFLNDKLGQKYLILESYDEIGEEGSVVFENYCEETNYLEDIEPTSVSVYLRNGSVEINRINLLRLKDEKSTLKASPTLIERRYGQITEKVKRINKYNKKHGRLWWAEVNELALKTFEEKKAILGITENAHTGGFEYYGGGVFELQKNAGASNTNPIHSVVSAPDFDWRYRHGKNWITPSKSQGGSGYCSAFSAISSTEAWVNLYYNQLINPDLSEQEAACCNSHALTHDSIYKKGMPFDAPLNYIRDVGVCDETAYPFVDSLEAGFICRSDEVTPNTMAKISGYRYVSKNDSIMKEALRSSGPLASGIHINGGLNHAMTIVGYGTIEAGDTVANVIRTENGMDILWHVHISNDDPRIGKTYWIFKNSSIGRHGYYYMIIDDLNVLYGPCERTGSVSWYERNNNGELSLQTHIECSDEDGDGYYFWGIGSKPADCPSWVPDEEDADDSDITIGPFVGNGEMMQLSCGLTISSPTVWTDDSLTCRIGIVRDGALTVNNSVVMNEQSSIRICEGGTFVVDGGTIHNAKLEIVPGSCLILRNNGSINIRDGYGFNAPLGAELIVECGVIS